MDGRLVTNFITEALPGKPITIYGNGNQTRSLCFISDLIECSVRVMECDAARNQVINLGNPEEHTVLHYAELIRELANSRSEIIFAEPTAADDPRRRQPEISKARNLISWEPQVSLRDGLTRTIAYFRQELGREPTENCQNQVPLV